MNAYGKIVAPSDFQSWIAARQTQYAAITRPCRHTPSRTTRRRSEGAKWPSQTSPSRRPTRPAPVAAQPVRRVPCAVGIVGAVLGYILFHWIGTKISANLTYQTETDQDDVAIFLGLVGATRRLADRARLLQLSAVADARPAGDAARARGARPAAVLPPVHRSQGGRDPVPGAVLFFFGSPG